MTKANIQHKLRLRRAPVPVISVKPSAPATISVSSSDQIFREIVQGLYEGRYATGQRLVESDLTREFGTSRGTVREALKRLAAEGIVTLNLHRGAQIRRLARVEVRDMLALLEVLIGFAAYLAADHIDEGKNARMFQTNFDAVMSYESRPDSFDLVRARNRFYRSLVDIGNNRELRQVLLRYHVHLLRVQFRPYRVEVETERFSDYRKIGEAVLAGDSRRAEAAARRHVRLISAAFEKLPQDAFSSPDLP